MTRVQGDLDRLVAGRVLGPLGGLALLASALVASYGVFTHDDERSRPGALERGFMVHQEVYLLSLRYGTGASLGLNLPKLISERLRSTGLRRAELEPNLRSP